MKIFWVFATYNELELLPYKIDYIVKNKMDCFVFDNMSTDGSWEWLRSNGIPSEQFDSKGIFNLVLIMNLEAKKIHEVKPDWVVMAAPDMFYVHLNHKNLHEFLEHIDEEGFNLVDSAFRTFAFKYTGIERPGIDPRLTYMFFVDLEGLKNACLAKYSPTLRISADHVIVPNARSYKSRDFVLLHYSIRHDGRERKMDQYHRIKKAWDSKLFDLDWGRGLEGMAEERPDVSEHLKFVSRQSDLSDVRESGFFDVVKNSVENG